MDRPPAPRSRIGAPSSLASIALGHTESAASKARWHNGIKRCVIARFQGLRCCVCVQVCAGTKDRARPAKKLRPSNRSLHSFRYSSSVGCPLLSISRPPTYAPQSFLRLKQKWSRPLQSPPFFSPFPSLSSMPFQPRYALAYPVSYLFVASHRCFRPLPAWDPKRTPDNT